MILYVYISLTLEKSTSQKQIAFIFATYFQVSLAY